MAHNVKQTASGNIRLTISKDEAALIRALIGPTQGDLGYGLYTAIGDSDLEMTFNHRDLDDEILCNINTDEVVIGG